MHPGERVLSEKAKHKIKEDDNGIPAKKKRIQKEISKRVTVPKLISSVDFNVASREAGTIQRVLLLNFMCHSKLEISFSPRINVITGRNGSGKSAVLNAIILALGGRSSDTNRGNKLKDFIQYGKKSASVHLTLRNVGPGAYKPNDYGDKITIVRYFKIDGGGGYRILNSSGKTVSTKKTELTDLEGYLNIQVDNPLALMNQEVSKTFLNSKNPKDKYDLFMKATMLNEIERHYTSAVEEKQSAVEILQKKLSELSDLRKTIISLNKRLGSFKTLMEHKNKLRSLKIESVWAQIHQKEVDCNRFQESMKRQRKKMEELERQVAQVASEIHDKDTVLSENKLWIKAVKQQYFDMSNNLKSAEEERNSLITELESRSCALEGVRREIKLSREDVYHSENAVKGYCGKYSNETSLSKDNIRIQLAELPDKILLLKQEIETRQSMADKVHKKIKELQESFNNLEGDKKITGSEIESYRTRLKEQQSTSRDRLNVYGKWMSLLIQKIDEKWNRGYFKEKPIGPVGAHITVKNSKWCLAVEACLSTLLTSFCVDNIEDCKILQQLVRESAGANAHRISVLVSPFINRVYDVSKYAVDTTKFKSIMEVLKVSNPVIMNCLIDHRKIEKVLLFEKVQQACSALNEETRIPRNCSLGFVATGQRVYPDPNFRVYCCNKARAEYLGVTVESSVKYCEEELGALEEKRRGILRVMQQITAEVKPLKQESSSYLHEIGLFESRVAKLQQQLTELNKMHIPYFSQIDPLNAEVESSNKRLSKLEQKEYNMELEVTLASQKRQEMVNRVNILQLELEKVKNKEAFLYNQVNDMKRSIDQLREAKQLYENQLNQAEDHYSKLRMEYESVKSTLGTYLDKIVSNSEFSNRVVTKRSPELIESEMLGVMRLIDSMSLVNTPKARDDLIHRLDTLKKEYHNLESMANNTNKLLHKLSSMVAKRGEFYKLYKSMIGLHVKFTFNSTMSNRQFNGDIDIDHDARTLNMTLSHHGGKVTKDVKSLSGGERSVSTVCLILALWGVIGCPFRILDEFDVFMDMVNRSACIKMLMEKSKSLSGRQFIFISPQDMSELNAYMESKKINVFRMQDPGV